MAPLNRLIQLHLRILLFLLGANFMFVSSQIAIHFANIPGVRINHIFLRTHFFLLIFRKYVNAVYGVAIVESFVEMIAKSI